MLQKREVRQRAEGDGGKGGRREQQRVGGSEWISTVFGHLNLRK